MTSLENLDPAKPEAKIPELPEQKKKKKNSLKSIWVVSQLYEYWLIQWIRKWINGDIGPYRVELSIKEYKIYENIQ